MLLVGWWSVYLVFFFFQAEDGIRDDLVTGVQTCALPIWPGLEAGPGAGALEADRRPAHQGSEVRGGRPGVILADRRGQAGRQPHPARRVHAQANRDAR